MPRQRVRAQRGPMINSGGASSNHERCGVLGPRLRGDDGRVLLPRFPDSLFKQPLANAPPPCFFAAPGTPSSLLSHPQNMRGMAHQVAQPLFLSCPWSLSKPRGASRRATQTSLRRLGLFAGVFLTAPGRASRWPSISGTAIRQPAPGGRLLLATGRSPGPPGCVLCGKHARGRRIRLHHQDASR
jgi:hypothetical protein